MISVSGISVSFSISYRVISIRDDRGSARTYSRVILNETERRVHLYVSSLRASETTGGGLVVIGRAQRGGGVIAVGFRGGGGS